MSNTISTQVKTLFNGLVAVRDRFPYQAYKEKKNLDIYVDGKKMIVPFRELRNYTMKSPNKFKDKFSDDEHYLIYYVWTPDGIYESKKLKDNKQEEL